jgi:hypothetical protein
MAEFFVQGFRERPDLRPVEKGFAEFEVYHFSKTLIDLLGVDRPMGKPSPNRNSPPQPVCDHGHDQVTLSARADGRTVALHS